MKHIFETTPMGGDEAMIPITGQGGDYVLSRHNTWVRIFDQGGGQYDHCFFIDDEGQGHGFVPTDELIQQMERTGFTFIRSETLDEATIEFFEARDRAQNEDAGEA